MSLKREDCIHPFDNGFVPEISKDRTGIIVTRRSPLISVSAESDPVSIASGAAPSLGEATAQKQRLRRLPSI